MAHNYAELIRTRVKPGTPPRRDPRARRVVDILKGPRTKRRYTVVLECGHTQRRRMLFEPDLLICTECPPCGGIGNNMGHH
jgi:hypothetical protein